MSSVIYCTSTGSVFTALGLLANMGDFPREPINFDCDIQNVLAFMKFWKDLCILSDVAGSLLPLLVVTQECIIVFAHLWERGLGGLGCKVLPVGCEGSPWNQAG